MNEPNISKLNFDELNRIGNNDVGFLKEMLITYRNSLTICVQNISNFYDQKDWASISNEAHKMAPSSHIVGAIDLYNLFKKLEDDCRDKIELQKIESYKQSMEKEAASILKKVEVKINNL